jgi:hypothetical protein
METPAAAPPRFCKLDDAGNDLPSDATSWSQVLDRRTNLIWLADPLDKELPWKKAVTAAEACVGGGAAWRLPTLDELESIRDITRYNPAIDTEFFRCPSDWFWTTSPWAGSPASAAWIVYFGLGYADGSRHDFRCFVRPVRSASVPGQ